jgi:Uma2 family endonuclease
VIGVDSLGGTLTIDDLTIPTEIDQLEVFRAWVSELGEDAPRVHFSRGRVWIQVSPQEYFSHLRLVGAINAGLELLAKELDLGEYWPDGGWLTNKEAGLSTEPDGFLVLWRTTESGAAQFVDRPGKGPIELVGRGDMVLEVVGDYSVAKDTVQLVADYAAAGFAEYWLVDGRRDPLSFRMLTLRADGTYADVEPDREGLLASPVWGRRFRIETSTNRAGRPSYQLVVRP